MIERLYVDTLPRGDVFQQRTLVIIFLQVVVSNNRHIRLRQHIEATCVVEVNHATDDDVIDNCTLKFQNIVYR